jgi:hypothetical protein
VHNTGSGKVDNTDATEGIVEFGGAEGGEETVAGPDGVDDNGVDESGKEEGVAQVSRHLTTFGNSSGHNGGGSGGESKLEEESSVVIKVLETKVTVSNKSLLGHIVSTVGESEANSVETNGTTTGIQKILQHDILDILLTDGSGTEHGETSLHHEHESSLLVMAGGKGNGEGKRKYDVIQYSTLRTIVFRA